MFRHTILFFARHPQGSLLFTRKLNTHVKIHPILQTRRVLLARTTLGLTLSSLALAIGGTTVFAEHEQAADEPKSSLCSMLRAYVVFSMCSIPHLVDSAPTILNTLSSVPLIREVMEAIMRVTFFKQVIFHRLKEPRLL